MQTVPSRPCGVAAVAVLALCLSLLAGASHAQRAGGPSWSDAPALPAVWQAGTRADLMPVGALWSPEDRRLCDHEVLGPTVHWLQSPQALEAALFLVLDGVPWPAALPRLGVLVTAGHLVFDHTRHPEGPRVHDGFERPPLLERGTRSALSPSGDPSCLRPHGWCQPPLGGVDLLQMLGATVADGGQAALQTLWDHPAEWLGAGVLTAVQVTLVDLEVQRRQAVPGAAATRPYRDAMGAQMLCRLPSLTGVNGGFAALWASQKVTSRVFAGRYLKEQFAVSIRYPVLHLGTALFLDVLGRTLAGLNNVAIEHVYTMATATTPPDPSVTFGSALRNTTVPTIVSGGLAAALNFVPVYGSPQTAQEWQVKAALQVVEEKVAALSSWYLNDGWNITTGPPPDLAGRKDWDRFRLGNELRFRWGL